MRWLLSLALLVAMTCSVSAQSVPDQTERAFRTFADGMSAAEFLGGRYGESVFAGAAGRWARLNGPDSKTGVETYGPDRDRFCAGDQAVTITLDPPYGAGILTTGRLGAFTQNYTLVAGSTFAEHTDPVDYLTTLGLGPDKVGARFDQQRAVSLVLINGLVQVYRPSPDVIVITRDRSYPVIFARCET